MCCSVRMMVDPGTTPHAKWQQFARTLVRGTEKKNKLPKVQTPYPIINYFTHTHLAVQKKNTLESDGEDLQGVKSTWENNYLQL